MNPVDQSVGSKLPFDSKIQVVGDKKYLIWCDIPMVVHTTNQTNMSILEFAQNGANTVASMTLLVQGGGHSLATDW